MRQTFKYYKCLLLFLVSILFLFIYKDFIFGNKEYIFLAPNSDFLVIIWPYKNYLISHFPNIKAGYIYDSGPGTNIFSIKSFLFDPFNFLALLSHSFGFLVILQLYVKLVFIALISYYALKARSPNGLYNVLFAFIFTFNGMFMYWGSQDFHLSAMIFILLQWLGYELYRKTNKIWIFIVCSLPLFNFSSAYWIIICNIFFIYFMFLDTAFDNLDTGQKIRDLFKIATGFLIVTLISLWSILPELWVLLHNSRVSGASGLYGGILHSKINTPIGILEPIDFYSLKLYAQFILRAFGNYTITPDKIWMSAFSGPLWYSSIFIIVSAVAYFISMFLVSIKVRINLIISLILLFGGLPLVILLFNGFSAATFRWSWLLLIPITICAINYWRANPNLNNFRLSIIALFFIVLFAASYEYYIGEIYFTNKNVLITYIEIGLVFILFFIFSYVKKYTFTVLIIIGIMDVIFNNYLFIANTQPILNNYQLQHKYYYDNTRGVLNQIKLNDHSKFYRIDKNYSSLNLCNYCGLNENLIQDYKGVKQYLSTPNPEYFKFSLDMGANPYYNFIFGFDGRYDILQMLGVKYILSKTKLVIPNYKEQSTTKDITVYKAVNYQGIGYVFHQYINYNQFIDLSSNLKDKVFSRCAIVKGNLQVNGFVSRSYQACLSYPSVLDKSDESFILEEFNENKIRGSITLNSSGMLYLAIPFDYGFSARVDGVSQPILNLNDGFLGLELSKGKHVIEISYFPPLLKVGLIISLLTFVLIISYLFLFRSKVRDISLDR